MTITRHITLPAGFSAAGVKAGIKTSGREDVAIIACDRPAAVAVVTTRNQVFGEPVRWVRGILPKGHGRARAMVINSGCSNVCTGPAGFRDARAMASQTAKLLGARAEEVLVASTGVIGHRLPMEKIRAGIGAAAGRLGRDDDPAVLRAIMTTDTREKHAVVHGRFGGKTVTLAGMVKGAGMIAPSMATMIGVLTTDAAIAPPLLHKALAAACEDTFNAITVDSDTSTSDTVAVFASGAAGHATIRAGSTDYARFAAMLKEACASLARAVVADGEGASRIIEVRVRGARNRDEAKVAAKSVADSPLFKCAVHGGDPNWGRIAAALGKSAAKVDPAKLAVRMGGETLFARGVRKTFNLAKVEAHLKGPAVLVDCDLGLGKGEFTALGCDLSREYIAINADYHT
jgi:glutamate N-acetyltransferase / amino-acid N-acetyltransferase